MVYEDTRVFTFAKPVPLPHLGKVELMAIDLMSPAFASRRVCFSTRERRVFCLG